MGMHHPTVPDGREQYGKRQLRPQDPCPQIAGWERNRVTRPEGYGVEGIPVRPQGDLTFGSAVDVVEHHPRQTTLGQAPQVLDVHDSWRCDGPRPSRQRWQLHAPAFSGSTTNVCSLEGEREGRTGRKDAQREEVPLGAATPSGTLVQM